MYPHPLWVGVRRSATTAAAGFRPLGRDRMGLGFELVGWLLESLGATVMRDVTEVMGAGWLSIIIDPTGAALGLWKAKTP